MDVVNDIIAFENGDLSLPETIKLFAQLIKTGMAWNLQGFYGRAAQSFIDNGYIDEQGNILTMDGAFE